MSSLRFKVPLIILSAVLITSAISGYSNYLTNVKLIENAEHQQLTMVSRLIQNKMVDASRIAAAKIALIVDRPGLKKAFREQNRQELINLTLPTFLTQSEKFGVRDAQFNLPPATVFLRLHNLQLYGDDDSSFREMILMSIKNKKAYEGIEIGRSGVSLRAIDVMEDEKGVIGTFEIGMSFSTILEDIKKNTNFEAAVFVQDQLFTKIATSLPRASQERIFGDLQGIGATDWNKILPNMSAELLNKLSDVTTFCQRINGVDYGVILLPLFDFKNTEIGVIVAISDFSNFQSLLKANIIVSAALAILQALILFGVVLITINVSILRPIEHLNNVASQWRGGEKAELDSYMLQREDELGELSINIDELRRENNE